MQKLSITDPVTNLTNHRYFQERIREEVERSHRREREFSLIMADVDHFEEFNDKFGHPEGDVALAKIAAAINRSTRVEDSVSRYGGENFRFFFPRRAKGAATADHGERIRRDTIEDGRTDEGMGLATYPADGTTAATQIIHAADQALV